MNETLLQKMAEFITLALENSQSLQSKLYELTKKAVVKDMEGEKYKTSVYKAADALYDSDFISDDYEKRTFIKKALEDNTYLARTLEKVCRASDVATIGKPANTKSYSTKYDMNDPVAVAAFGLSSGGIIDE